MSKSWTLKKPNPGNKPGKKNQVSNKKQMLQSAVNLITQNKQLLHELRRITRIKIQSIYWKQTG